MIMLLTIFLNSCKTKIICAQIKSAEIKPLKLCDISFQFKRCRCRCFDINKWNTLPIKQCTELATYADENPQSFTPENIDSSLDKISQSESVNLPIESCDAIGGFTLNDMAKEIMPNIKKLNAVKNDYCQ